jgi:hypothetical protein
MVSDYLQELVWFIILILIMKLRTIEILYCSSSFPNTLGLFFLIIASFETFHLMIYKAGT